MKKIITFMIAAAMLSAGVYAAPAENEIAFEEPPVAAETFVPDYGEDEDGLPDVVHGDEVHGIYEELFPELGDIQKYLEENGYPDYVSFIFNAAVATNGYDPTSGEEYQPKLTYWWDIGVVNATAEQKAEIQAIIDDLYPIENIITFVDCTYSHAEREALMPEVRETVRTLFPDLTGDLTGFDVSLILNTEQIGVTFDFPGPDDTDLDAVKKKLYGIYGDLVFVDRLYVFNGDADDFGEDLIGAIPESDGMMGAGTEIGVEEIAPEIGDVALPVDGDVDAAPAVGEVAAIAPPADSSNDNTVMWICITAALVVALGTAAFICRAKLIPVFATSNGDVTAKKVGKKQAEEAVKNSEVIPDDSVLQAIREKLDK